MTVYIRRDALSRLPSGGAAPDQVALGIEMQNSIKVRKSLRNGNAEIRMLLKHPMDVGRRLKNGEVIPAHFISRLTCRHGHEIVMQAHWGAGISANPYVAFTLEGVNAGDKITIDWLDNQGNSDSLEVEM